MMNSYMERMEAKTKSYVSKAKELVNDTAKDIRELEAFADQLAKLEGSEPSDLYESIVLLDRLLQDFISATVDGHKLWERCLWEASKYGAKDGRCTLADLSNQTGLLRELIRNVENHLESFHKQLSALMNRKNLGEYPHKLANRIMEFEKIALDLVRTCEAWIVELERMERDMRQSSACATGSSRMCSDKEESPETYVPPVLPADFTLLAYEPERMNTGSLVPPPMHQSAPAKPAASQPPSPMFQPAPAKPSAAAAPEPKAKKSLFSLFPKRGKSKSQQVSPPQIDSVQFSAVAPDKAVPGKYIPVNIVMYEDKNRNVLQDIIRSISANALVSNSGYTDVARNSTVKVCLSSPDVLIEDGEEERVWNGNYLNFEFAVKIPVDITKDQILLKAAVYINGIIATRLKLILDCAGQPKRNLSVARTDISSAFVSYASQDRNRVAAIIQGMRKARPDLDIFFDIESLRSGQMWETALRSEIENRDILFLCWSRYARDSSWVEMEWRYALENKGEDSIEPIPIDSPDLCPPPQELQSKHFNDKMLYIIKATEPEQPRQPFLLRVKTGERSEITKPMIRIGKERSYVDICIHDNSAVSRAHANIIFRDGCYYIVDTNSLNHTYINGEMIPSNREVPIHNGTKIRLANEDFEFIL